MRFAENLMNYVRENGFSVNDFALGDWLENLTDDRLTTLIELGEKFCQGSPEQEVDDFFGVAIYAASVERRVDKLNFTPEELFDLGCALIHGALVESHRRKKIAVVKGKIRLYPFPTDEISLPEQGRLVRHGYTGLHKGFPDAACNGLVKHAALLQVTSNACGASAQSIRVSTFYPR